MICADDAKQVEARRKAFLRKWRLKCGGVADSLEEAGELNNQGAPKKARQRAGTGKEGTRVDFEAMNNRVWDALRRLSREWREGEWE